VGIAKQPPGIGKFSWEKEGGGGIFQIPSGETVFRWDTYLKWDVNLRYIEMGRKGSLSP